MYEHVQHFEVSDKGMKTGSVIYTISFFFYFDLTNEKKCSYLNISYGVKHFID